MALECCHGLESLGYERCAFFDKFGNLLLHCSLSDEQLLKDLDAYASGNPAMDHYDVAMATQRFASVLDSPAPRRRG